MNKTQNKLHFNAFGLCAIYVSLLKDCSLHVKKVIKDLLPNLVNKSKEAKHVLVLKEIKLNTEKFLFHRYFIKSVSILYPYYRFQSDCSNLINVLTKSRNYH